MKATISMDGLWALIDSLPRESKEWLAKKLQDSLSLPLVSEENEILSGIARSVRQAKAGETYPLDTLWGKL